MNPQFPPPLRAAERIKYVRTVITEILYMPLLLRELRRADVVHVFSASYSSFLLAPLPAVVIARVLGRPVILNYRSGQAADHLKGSALARCVLGRVESNVVPSRYLVDVFAAFGIDASIIPNIVDGERFRYREREPLRPLLLSTRNFDDLYNVACTVRAFGVVQRHCPQARLTLVGGGSEEQRLHALVRDLGLRHVTFAGRVGPDEIARHYADHDIYVQTPNIDNMPTSVIEAFASGLPVVSTRAGGVPTILTDGQHGLLAPLDDHEAVAACVLDLLANPDRARRLARTAHEASRACTWRAVRDQWLDAYRRVARGAARALSPAGAVETP